MPRSEALEIALWGFGVGLSGVGGGGGGGVQSALMAYLLLPEMLSNYTAASAPSEPLLLKILLQYLTQRWSRAIIPPAL